MHEIITPAIHYWGTPVVILSTLNEDGTPNLAPMSSECWLLQRCTLGLAANSQTTKNLRRTGQCVINLVSEDMTARINALAKTRGSPNLTPFKQKAGYRHVKDKFAAAHLSPQASVLVEPPRILECPVQMEAELVGVKEMKGDEVGMEGYVLGLEVKILLVHAESRLLLNGYSRKVDAENWRSLINSFKHYYGLRERLEPSKLAEIDEEMYRRCGKWGWRIFVLLPSFVLPRQRSTFQINEPDPPDSCASAVTFPEGSFSFIVFEDTDQALAISSSIHSSTKLQRPHSHSNQFRPMLPSSHLKIPTAKSSSSGRFPHQYDMVAPHSLQKLLHTSGEDQ